MDRAASVGEGIIEFPLTNPNDEAPVTSIDEARTDVQQAMRALMAIADLTRPRQRQGAGSGCGAGCSSSGAR